MKLETNHFAAALLAAALPFSTAAQDPACEWTMVEDNGAIVNTGSTGENGNLALTAGAEMDGDVPTVNTGGKTLRISGDNPTAAAESASWFDPLAGAEAFTIMAWVRRESASTSANQSARIFSDIDARGTTAYGMEFRFAEASGRLTLRVNGQEVASSTASIPPDNGSWHHVAVVYDGRRLATNYATRNVHFYVDGVQKGYGNVMQGLAPTANGVPVTLGNSSAGRVSENVLAGSIDDVFVFRDWAPEPSGNGNLNLDIRYWMLLDDAQRVPATDDEAEPDDGEEHAVPPVIVEDVVVQAIGREREYEELPVGLIFVDATSGELCYVNEENPLGRTVCVCKDFPDWHSFTNTVRLNGNKLELNAHYSLMAESYALSARYGTNTVWSVVGEEFGDLAGLTVSLADPNTLMLSCNAVGEGAVLQVCTNLLEENGWKTPTNAVLVSETDIAKTWRITLMMGQPGAEFYRVLNNGASVAKGFHVYPTLHPHGGVEMDGVTWTNFPDMGSYATTGALAAAVAPLATTGSVADVSGRVSTIEGDYVKAADISDFATTNDVASVERRATDLEASTNALVAALAAATNRIAELEWETGEYWCKWNVNDLSITQTNWVPTNWPARRICVEVRSLGESNTAVIAIRKGWYPPKKCEIDFVFAGWAKASGTVKIQLGDVSFATGNVSSPSTTSFTIIKLCWNPDFDGMWTPTKTGFNNYWNRLDSNGNTVNWKVGNTLFKPVWDLPEPSTQ